MVTITNNSSGGQPVSLKDLRELRAICNKHGFLFFLNADRFTKNTWFIKIRSPGQQERRLKDIVRDIFDLADVRRSCRDTDRSSDRSRW